MIPIKKGVINTDIPNVAVETSDSNIPRKPILVEGEPTPIEPIIESLEVSENGTYEVGEGLDGFNPVIVNVDKSKPGYVELVDFDLKNSSLLDKIRNYIIPSQNYNNVSTTTDGLVLTATNSNCNISFVPNTNSFYELKIKFGTNTDTSELNQYNALLKLNRTDAHQTLTYCRDVQVPNNPMGTWRLNDQSGSVEYLPVGYGDSHYFDNKELIIEYGYYYNNDEFTINLNKFSYKIGNEYIYIGTSNFIINPNGNPIILLGGGGAVMKGTIIESVKIKQLFKWNLERTLLNNINESEVM